MKAVLLFKISMATALASILTCGPALNQAIASDLTLFGTLDDHRVIQASVRWTVVHRFSPDGRKLVTTGMGPDGFLVATAWDVERWQRLGSERLPEGHCPDVKPDGSIIWLDNASVKKWHWTQKRTFTNFTSFPYLSMDDPNRGVEVYEIGNRIAVLDGHAGVVNSVIFNHDQTKAITAGSDKKVIVWDLSNGRPLKTVLHDCIPYSALLSPDERELVAGCDDGTMHLWRLAYSPEELRELGQRLERKISAPTLEAAAETAELRFKLH